MRSHEHSKRREEGNRVNASYMQLSWLFLSVSLSVILRTRIVSLALHRNFQYAHRSRKNEKQTGASNLPNLAASAAFVLHRIPLAERLPSQSPSDFLRSTFPSGF
ncbi:hypothetical protein ILYODFUR_003578 [Ilyodon furcidens]